MSLLNVSELGFAYPSTGVLFSGASFSIDPGDRLAIVGGNGTGKSTLLRLLAGELPPSQGEIARRAGMRIAHVLQEQAAVKEQPLFDFVLGDLARMRHLMAEYERGVQSIAPAEYAAAVNEYGSAGGYTLQAETERILDGLGFTVAEFSLPLASLSGGQRTRAALARALNAGADLLLLDEPTNHLDIAAREWLERELGARSARACALVSHDRTLLGRVASRVLEIHRGKITLFEYGYEEYRAACLIRERQAWQNYEAYERRKAAAEEAALKRARLAVKVAATPDGARSSHDFYRRKAGKVARTGRLLRERVNHEPRVDKPWEEAPIPALDFGMVRRSGGIALSVHGLAKSFANKTLFTGFDFHLARGERLAILGPNGSGKTTLLRILLGEERADAGEVRTGVNVIMGYLAQDTEDLDGAATPLQVCGGSTLPRTLLGCLKLRPDRVNQPVAELSPGERAKVALVRLLVSGANLLLLDEPTNHLEIEAQQALEQALAQYPGSVVIVSHDRTFLAGLGEGLKRIEL